MYSHYPYEEQLNIIDYHDSTMLRSKHLSTKQIYILSKEIVHRRGEKWLSFIREYERTIAFYKKAINEAKTPFNKERLQADYQQEMVFFKSEFALYNDLYNERYGKNPIWNSLRKNQKAITV